LRRVTDLNDADRQIGHQRVYTRERFHKEFSGLRLRIVQSGGIFLKPLSNAQMESQLSPEQLEAFLALGAEFPDLAAEIYVVCKRAS
jgi:hypothetical protein